MTNINRIYNVVGVDTQQMDSRKLNGLHYSLNEKLIKLDSSKYYRFVKAGNCVFMQSNDDDANNIFDAQEVSASAYCEYLFDMDNVYNDQDSESFFHIINNSVFMYARIVNFNSCRINDLGSIGDYVISVRRMADSQSKTKLDFGRNQHSSSFGEAKADHEGEGAYNENDELLKSVIRGEESLFKTESFFFVKGQTLEDANFKMRELVRSCNTRGIKVFIENVGAKYCLENLSGLYAPEFINSFTLQSSLVASMIPVHVDMLYDYGIRLLSQYNSEMFYDLFHNLNLNYNCIVAGPSGSGKSFLIGGMCYFYMQKGINVVNIERGDSMKKIARIKDSIDLLECFNPLFSKDPKYLYEFIIAMMGDTDFNKKDKGRLFLFLREADLSSINNLSSLVDLLDSDFPEIKYSAVFIEDYVTDRELVPSSFSRVNIEELSDEVLSPFIIFVLEYMEQLEGRTMLFLDEVHHLLKKNKDYVEKKYREGRKKNHAILSATHDIDEFLCDPVGKVLEKCSFTKIIFNQAVSPKEGLTEFDCENINLAKTVPGLCSEFYLKTESFAKICRYVATPFLYEALTSNADDNERQNRYIESRKDFLSYTDALSEYVERKYV